MDKIIIKGLKVFAYHGVNEEETQFGQNFLLDIEAQADLSQAGKTDNLNDTVSYAQMMKTVRRVMTEENNQLLERAAQRTADALLREFDRLESVKIRLMKPEAPMKAELAYTAVEMERKRENR
ncbi:MAG TPA: dihydroneopterin aldolase [Ruminococcaceae bacterium]|nr:dihydroneopterin aldolase [Oscillospiraceae bacterium]